MAGTVQAARFAQLTGHGRVAPFASNPWKSARTLLSGSSIGGSPALESYGQLPLSFEANQGQAGPGVDFLSHGNGYGLMLSPGEAALSLQQGSGGGNVLLMNVVGANPLAPAVGMDELPGKSNYFIGNDPRHWQTNVPNYEKVAYANIYAGINLVYYGDQRQLEYDFQVNPGANPVSSVSHSRGRRTCRSTPRATWFCTPPAATSSNTPRFCTSRSAACATPFQDVMSSKPTARLALPSAPTMRICLRLSIPC
jgi:hypothetical protein